MARKAAPHKEIKRQDDSITSGLESLSACLLDWYERHKRRLPWRETRDPYHVWVSEIMLQQTRVATAVDFYERWIERFPNLEALAGADTDEVLGLWQGLGYYSRARNLHRAATQVVHDHGGRVPRSMRELLSLPGVGPYSAGAIASIAFGAHEPAVDGNVIRVVSRLFRVPGHPKQPRMLRDVDQLARQLLPRGSAGEFNQALMELGATTCTPRAPRCDACPVQRYCQAYRHDQVLEFPQPSPRPVLIEERRAVAVVTRRSRRLAVQVAEHAPRWAGLWQFPDVSVQADAEGATGRLESEVLRATGVGISVVGRQGQLRHQVTRHRIDLDVYACAARSGRARALGYAATRWCTDNDLRQLAMSAPHRKIAQQMANARKRSAS